jgi:hypothetical protein
MCYAIPQPVYFSWQCVMRYHDQCISPSNVLCGTTTSVFQLAMCYVVPQPGQHDNAPYGTTTSAIWQCAIRYHNQCNMTMRHTVPQPVQHDNAPYGNTTSVFHMAICHTVPRPVSFTWQCAIRYHDQRLSHGTKVENSTPSSDEV